MATGNKIVDQASRDGADNRPVIVAIGASAGGVQALQSFFGGIPQNTGAAFIVVVHLDPQHRSELSSIVAARTSMPVIQVEKTAHLEPNRVYVIPPDRRLQVIDHQLLATEFEEPRGQRLPIDFLFRSVAERLGDGFAIILSGAGSDGALGVRAVKEAGGIILVQDPNEADYASMPRSAIETGAVDFILPVWDLAKRLGDLIRIKDNVWPPEMGNLDEEALRRILAHLRVRTGHDFSKYKRSTVVRRIARRMQVNRTDAPNDYYDIVRENPNEVQALLSDLLISVTAFFRDREAFESLEKLLPEVFASKGADQSIRVWVAGCATGEEAYSTGILLLEEAARRQAHPHIQVFGTDLDVRALAAAREGRYPVAIEADVSEGRLRRFFSREGNYYRVRQELRDIMLFALQDLLKDPPFSHVELVSCRNVLIYLDRELQEQVCSTFHYALNPGGYLFLGAAEAAENPPSLFRNIDRHARIYQSTRSPGAKPQLLPRLLGPIRVREQMLPLPPSVSPAAALSEAAAHRRAIEEIGFPSILVDEAYRVVHLSDNASRYLLPSGGPLTADVTELVRPELRFEVRSCLHRAFDQRRPSLSLPVKVRVDGATYPVQVQANPLQEAGEWRRAVIVFINGEAVDETTSIEQQISDEAVHRLKEELDLTQQRLRTMREESDAATEELRASNEELQSINEEYRSTSEELETSKEELQSINEELQTVNSELKSKLELISRANSDLQNLLAATDFGTLFLDSGLNIKRFTDQVRELFSITASDEGRPITDFAHQLEYDDLVKDARMVIANLTPVRREVRSRKERWYDLRMRPYRTVDDKIDGVVITFVDVTERKLMEERLRSLANKAGDGNMGPIDDQ
jgi:two-component system, chemotaxis family, CheB/CheR fusion protein